MTHECDTIINTTGKEEKHAQGVYWFRYSIWPLLSIIITQQDRNITEPPSNAFFIDIRENNLTMIDLFDAERYTLTKQVSSPISTW